jgi:hypothetical protein
MKVTLQLGESRDGARSFGRIEDSAGPYTGTLVYEGRQACVQGDDGTHRDLPDELFCPALLADIERVCQPIWGEEWSKPLAEICGLDNRNFSRGRVARNGLPPHAIAGLLRLAERPDAAGLAYALRGLGRYIDKTGGDAEELSKTVLDQIRAFRSN